MFNVSYFNWLIIKKFTNSGWSNTYLGDVARIAYIDDTFPRESCDFNEIKLHFLMCPLYRKVLDYAYESVKLYRKWLKTFEKACESLK